MKIGMESSQLPFDDEIELQQFWKHLGGPPNDTTDIESFSSLLGVTPFNGQKAFPIKFRERQSLISGKLRGLRFSNGEMHVCTVKNCGDLSLNPTRAINHRAEELLAGRDWSETLLKKESCNVLKGLDGKDNLCPASLSRSEYRRAERRYFESCLESISGEMRRAWLQSQGYDLYEESGEETEAGRGISVTKLSARSVETYWEFATESSSALLDHLEPILRTYWRESKTTDHGFESAFERDAKTVTIFKNKGTSIKLYAKKTDRLRIEVTHTPPDAPKLISSYSTSSLDGLYEIKDELARKAAIEVNELLGFVEEFFETSPQERANKTEFLGRWFARMGYDTPSCQLLDILRASGRIVGGSGFPKSLQRKLKVASENGLLVKTGATYHASFASTSHALGEDLTYGADHSKKTSHNSVTHGADDKFVTRCESRVRFRARSFPPSPPSIRIAN